MSIIRRRPHSTQRIDGASSEGKLILPTHVASTNISWRGKKRARPAVAVAVCTIIVALTLTWWIYLIGRLSKVENKNLDMIDSSPSPLRISSSDLANITQFFPCISDVSIPPYLAEIEPILHSHRRKSRGPRYDSLPCAPRNKNMCFRAVYDGFDQFVSDAHNHDHPHAPGEFVPKEDLVDKIAIILESLILHQEAPQSTTTFESVKTKPTILKGSIKRHKNYTSEPKDFDEAINFGQLHADYFESAQFVYTSILYDQPPEDLLGGETALANYFTSDNGIDKVAFGMKIKENQTSYNALLLKDNKESEADNAHANGQLPIEFTSGMIVEPKRGRLVLFTAGGENFHAPMAVERGVRPTFHFWFNCKSEHDK